MISKLIIYFICVIAFTYDAFAITTQYKQLLDSSTKGMNVNGSSVNKTYSYSPGSGTVRIKSLSVLLQDEGTTSFNKFGAITALTNGIVIQWSKGGSTTTFATIKDNSDVTNIFSDMQHFGNSAVLSILSVVTPQGFGNTNNVFRGKTLFNGGDNLLSDSDSISAIVKDNLTNIDTLEMGVVIETD